MKKAYSLIVFIISSYMCVFIATSPSLAVEDEDITYPTATKAMYPVISKKAEVVSAPSEEKAEKFKMDFSLSVIGGYDTNVDLRHYDPNASFFIQEAFGARAKYPLSDSWTLRGEYDLTSIKYLRDSDPDLLNNIIKVGLDGKITSSLLWSIDYFIDFVDYPQDKTDKYTINALETALRQDITDRLYHKIIYKFSYKHYPNLKTRNRGGYFRLGDRKDTRNTLEHELGLYLTDKTLIKADNTIYFNNSNDLYLDYYDYTALKAKGTIIHLITDKLYALANVGYQYTRYKNRIVSDIVSDDQRDHLLMSGASLFYDITPVATIGTNFNYRKNFSNEGEEKYTDYIISSGLYVKF